MCCRIYNDKIFHKMNKKFIWTIIVLVLIGVFFYFSTIRTPKFPIREVDKFLPPAEPVSGTLTTKKTIYDEKLGYGFEQPSGWELSTTERGFTDKNIKKVISLTKNILKNGSQVSTDIEFTVKSAKSLQEVKYEVKKEIKGSGLSVLNEIAIVQNKVNGFDILSGTSDWKIRYVAFFSNKIAYIFKYSSQNELYMTNEETFNQIKNSLAIK